MNNLKTILGVITAILVIIGAVWTFGFTFATNERVDKVEITSGKKVVDLEIQIAGALQNQQSKSDVRYWQFMYDKLTNDMYEMKRQMRRYPEDEVLKQDYIDLLDRRKGVKTKLENAMQRIKVQ
jgi:hypothetical protein